jgi:hypothetical protein
MMLWIEDDAEQAKLSSNNTFNANLAKGISTVLQHVRLLASPAQ